MAGHQGGNAHLLPGVGIPPVLHNLFQVVQHQPDGNQRHAVALRGVHLPQIAFHGVGQRIQPGGRRPPRRNGVGQLRIHDGQHRIEKGRHNTGFQRTVLEGKIPGKGHFTAGSRCGRNADDRQSRLLEGAGPAAAVVVQLAAVCGNTRSALRHIHGASAAKTDDRAGPKLHRQLCRPVDGAIGRVGLDIGKDCNLTPGQQRPQFVHKAKLFHGGVRHHKNFSGRKVLRQLLQPPCPEQHPCGGIEIKIHGLHNPFLPDWPQPPSGLIIIL